MIPDNDWYGHKRALAEYCGRRPAPIFGSVVHGWVPTYEGGARRLSLAPVFVWNARHEADLRARGVPNVVGIGAPFAHLAAARAAAPRPTPAGTLCFPSHSADRARAEHDVAGLVAAVEATCPGPFTVSVFYQDLERPELRAAYEAAGWRVVSFGTRADVGFLGNLHDELLRHEVAVADRIGSGLWYAGLLGLGIRVLGPAAVVRGNFGIEAYDTEVRRRWPELHEGGVDGEQARALAEVELGTALLRPPDELARLLGWGTWRGLAARLLRPAYDLRAGRNVRAGEPGRA